MQEAAPGALDGYLDSILPVMETDLFGDIAEAKEADAFAAKYRYKRTTTSVALDCYSLLQQVDVYMCSLMQLNIGHWRNLLVQHTLSKKSYKVTVSPACNCPGGCLRLYTLIPCYTKADSLGGVCREAKKCKAYDMYQLLARMVSFRANIGQLLGSVRTHLSDASQPKVYNKLSSLLQHASRGILANPTAQPQDLMVFVHGVLEGGLAQEEAAREAAEAEATAAVRVLGKLAIHDIPKQELSCVTNAVAA